MTLGFEKRCTQIIRDDYLNLCPANVNNIHENVCHYQTNSIVTKIDKSRKSGYRSYYVCSRKYSKNGK